MDFLSVKLVVDGGVFLQDWLRLIHMELAIGMELYMGAFGLQDSSKVESHEDT